MKDKVENLRDLLFHLKSRDGWLKKNRPEEYEAMDKRCKEELYNMVAKEVEYFSKKVYCNLNEVIYTIPISILRRNKPSDIYELQQRVNGLATGVFGFEYDNQTSLAVTNCYGSPFRMYVSAYDKKYYEFTIYNSNAQGILYRFSELKKDDSFTKEHLDELEKIEEYQKEYYKKLEEDRNRYIEIKKYAEYIKIERVSSGYAHCIKEVTVKKDIPITLTSSEIAKYADSWNYCFGGSISKIREDNNETVYRVRINTD